MAAIHALPVRLDGPASRHLTEQLEARIASGVDPGSRAHQIEVLLATLRKALRTLNEAFAAVAEPLPVDDRHRRAAEEKLQRFVRAVEELIEEVDPYGATSEGFASAPGRKH